MIISRILIGTVLIAPLLAACSPNDGGDVIVNRISVGDGTLSVKADSEPDAVISSAGGLRIEGREVALTATQKSVLKRYYTDALQLRTDRKDVSVAGAKIGGAAIGSAITGLLGGKPDEKKLEASSTQIQHKVATLCNHLADLNATQQSAGKAIPAFEPYAQINLGDCRQGEKRTES